MIFSFLKSWIGKLFLVSFVVTGLIACGVSTQEQAPADSPTTIFDFSLEGNIDPSGATQRVDLISDGIFSKSGLFHMAWDAESSDPYSVLVHISTDNSATLGVGDQLFLVTECGSDNLSYACDSMGDQQCAVAYEPDLVLNPGPDMTVGTDDDFFELDQDRYYIRCNHGPATTTQAEITSRLQAVGFPVVSLTNYIVFTVCNRSADDCQSQIIPLEIVDLPE